VNQARGRDQRTASPQSQLGGKHSGQRDEGWFKREIAPKLDGFSLKEIADATGLLLAACSRIRASAKVPHPSHWGALRDLVAVTLARLR
jgi:hypothetical protein